MTAFALNFCWSGLATAKAGSGHAKFVTLSRPVERHFRQASNSPNLGAEITRNNVRSQNSTSPQGSKLSKGSFEQQEAQLFSKKEGVIHAAFRSGRPEAQHIGKLLNQPRALGTFQRHISDVRYDRETTLGIDRPSEPAHWLFNENLIARGIALIAFSVAVLLLLGRRTKLRRRREKRHPCALPCTITLSKQTLPAVITDISCLGAKLKIAGTYDPGMDVDLRVANLSLNTQIQWANEPYVGLQFSKPLPDSLVRTLLERSIASQQGSHDSPALLLATD